MDSSELKDLGRGEMSPPPRSFGLVLIAIFFGLATTGAGWYVLSVASDQAKLVRNSPLRIGLLVAAAGIPLLLLPAFTGLAASLSSRRAQNALDHVNARSMAAKSRERSMATLGICGAVWPILAAVIGLTAHNGAVRGVFFNFSLVKKTFGGIIGAMVQNFIIATVAMLLVLILGLLVAIARQMPGRAGRPIRALAIAYVDVFRAIPAIILVYVVGFGLPLTGLPFLSSLPAGTYATIALSLTYSAFAAEGYRAGIESIHASQMAAARSIGFNTATALRLVIIPQAVRRIIPNLLGYYIGLQKDTALIGVLGLIDAFAQARIYSANHFNLTPVTVVCGLFIVLTIPQTRFVDYLVTRDNRRMGRE